MKTRFFSETLLAWNARENTRQMPWKGIKDPYKIWLSEVILQQTRVDQGLAYYERFVRSFPSIQDLASAPDEQVFKLWEGLGYYSRCRNLVHTARFVAEKLGGHFPDNFEGILALKGVGPYTAAAIASFAYGLPQAVVDGNVLRVLSRFFGVRTPVDTTGGKKILTDLAERCLDTRDPGRYNQALMDFGAVVCKPASPSCASCPLQDNCAALQAGMTGMLPAKSKRMVRRDRHFVFLVVVYGNEVYVRKRTGRDIWQNLYEFIGHETEGTEGWDDLAKILSSSWFHACMQKTTFQPGDASPVYRQLLTHQQVRAKFLAIHVDAPLENPGEFTLAGKEKLSSLPFPRLLNDYMQASSLVFLRKN